MDHAGNLRRTIVQALVDYEILAAICINSIAIFGRDNATSFSNKPEFQQHVAQALAHAFIFKANRVLRIAAHAGDRINVARKHRKALLKLLEPVRPVRDANEHWTDPARKETSKPALYHHEESGVAVDDVILVLLGADKIMVGSINLFDVYSKLREIANDVMVEDGQRELRPVI